MAGARSRTAGKRHEKHAKVNLYKSKGKQGCQIAAGSVGGAKSKGKETRLVCVSETTKRTRTVIDRHHLSICLMRKKMASSEKVQ